MTSSVSPYLQRPVRKLEDVKPEAKSAASQTPTVAADAANAGSANAPAPSLGPQDVTGDRR